VEIDVVVDDGGDEEIGVVVPHLHAQRERLPLLEAGRLEVLRLELLCCCRRAGG
jgi:hypothetical protein